MTIQHLNARLANNRLPRELRTGISKFLDKPVPSPETEEVEPYKRKRCLICSYKNDRKTNLRCVRCKKPVCLPCVEKICIHCARE